MISTSLLGKAGNAFRMAHQLAFLGRSQWWPQQRIRAWQDERLTRILRHAIAHVPYYRDLGITLGNEPGTGALQRFPLLTKDIIQREGVRLVDPTLDRARLHSSVTSGSSGQPTTTWFDNNAWLLCKYALKIRRTLDGGRAFGERLMIFGEAADESIEPRTHHRGIYRELRLSVFLPPEQQHQALWQFQPTMIYGAPSALRALCDYARERDLELPPVRTVFLSSELIADGLRANLKHLLRCRVVGVYGSTEFKEVAAECPAQRYHVNFESVHVENLDPEEPGAVPRLALTTLVNRAMPLIRFDIGDHARIAEGRCACGRESPSLDSIEGRRVEYLQLRDGRRISPYLLTTHIETVPGLRQYQIVQRRDGTVELRVVILLGFPSPAASAAELQRRLADLVGPATPVLVSIVDAIRRTAAGKHLVVTRED